MGGARGCAALVVGCFSIRCVPYVVGGYEVLEGAATSPRGCHVTKGRRIIELLMKRSGSPLSPLVELTPLTASLAGTCSPSLTQSVRRATHIHHRWRQPRS